MAEKALTAVILETYIQGISTRPIHDLVKAMGMSGISKSQVSRLCGEIDVKVETFLDRPIEGEWSYIRIDATNLKVRRGGRIVPVAAIIAVGVNADGSGWRSAHPRPSPFEQSSCKLTRRGLGGVKLVVSDARESIKTGVSKVLNATWQRCRVDFMRNALAHTGKSARRVVSAFIAKAFAQATPEAASTQWRDDTLPALRNEPWSYKLRHVLGHDDSLAAEGNNRPFVVREFVSTTCHQRHPSLENLNQSGS